MGRHILRQRMARFAGRRTELAFGRGGCAIAGMFGLRRMNV
jgi:hypothetical protein